MHLNKTTPPPISRPPLARWVWERFEKLKDAGAYFGMSGEAVRGYCLPFGHPDRKVPRPEAMERIYERTGGEITPDSFHQLATRAEPRPGDLVQAY